MESRGLGDVYKRQQALGGLEAYQSASILGQDEQRGGDTSKVLVKWLKELDVRPKDRVPLRSVLVSCLPTPFTHMTIQSDLLILFRFYQNGRRMLEIGALSPTNHAAVQSWISNTPIDLHSQHPDILEQDFLQRPLPPSEADAFDVVSCSLVLNFVPGVHERGECCFFVFVCPVIKSSPSREHVHGNSSTSPIKVAKTKTDDLELRRHASPHSRPVTPPRPPLSRPPKTMYTQFSLLGSPAASADHAPRWLHAPQRKG